jgi:hypothetical protein
MQQLYNAAGATEAPNKLVKYPVYGGVGLKMSFFRGVFFLDGFHLGSFYLFRYGR